MRIIGSAALILLVSAIGASAQQGDPAAGEDAFVAICRKCHNSAAQIVRRIDGDTTEDRSAWLDSFLAGHHLTDMDAKADLIAYLANL
jgi:cytochrome c2